jgi:signal transduction histidine kinase
MMKSDKGPLTGPDLREEIESVSTEIRRICEDLSPSVLENVGLVAALDFLLSRSIENHKFSADASVEERIEFPLNMQLQIYRIAQEVLANIRRHSDADLVEMIIESPDDGQFLLSIKDNGKLFQPDGSTGKGRGIANIRSRANLIGGRVGWRERAKGGNTFSLRVVRQ